MKDINLTIKPLRYQGPIYDTNGLIGEDYMKQITFNNDNNDNELDYIGNILDNIFSKLVFKIYQLRLREHNETNTCLIKNLLVKPSTDTIYLKSKYINIKLTTPLNIGIQLYKLDALFSYPNDDKPLIYRIKISSAKIEGHFKDCLDLMNIDRPISKETSTCHKPSDYGNLFRHLQFNMDHLFIEAVDLKLAIQIDKINANKKQINITLIRLLDKRFVYGYICSTRLLERKHLSHKKVYLHLDKHLLEYFKKIFILINQKYPSSPTNFIEDSSSQTTISENFNIIEDYLNQTGPIMSETQKNMMNRPLKTRIGSINTNGDEVGDGIGNDILQEANNSFIDDEYNTLDYVCDDYFKLINITKYQQKSCQASYNYSYKSKNNKILVYDTDNKPCAKLVGNYFKYHILPSGCWTTTLSNIRLGDLTNSLWKNICYKIGNNPFISVKGVHHEGQHSQLIHPANKNSYYIDIKVEKFAINLDELFLKQFIPLIENVNKTISLLDNVFEGEPLFIIQCIVNHINTVISYKPRGLNVGNIINGNSQELIRLGTIRDMDMDFKDFTINNTFGVGELLQSILVNLEKELVVKGSLILGHVGILKQIFSPGLRANQVLNMNGTILQKAKKYATHVSSDALELASRTTISIETVLDTVLGKTNDTSKLQKRKLLENMNLSIIVKGITMSLLSLQTIIDPKQRDRNKMRYG